MVPTAADTQECQLCAALPRTDEGITTRVRKRLQAVTHTEGINLLYLASQASLELLS